MKKMTNTLFRFATMRSPELINDGDKEKFFVYHPDPADEGHFKSLVANPIADATARVLAWKNLAASFAAFQSPAQVKAFIGNSFYDFANWLAKNAKAISENGDPVAERFQGQTSLSHAQVISLWDNLFYQLITGKSAYVRDLLINALIANHYLEAAETDKAKTAISRVVIPQEFYGTVSLPVAQPNNEPVYTRELNKQIGIVLAGEKASLLSTAIDELKKAREAYNRINMQQYDEARIAYEFSKLQNGENNNPANETGAGLTPSPDTEPFSFTPAPEMNKDFLSVHLSARSLELINELITDGSAGFDSAFTLLNEALQKQTDISFTADNLSNRVVNINNVLLPVANSVNQPGQQYAFTMQVAPAGGNLVKVVAVINMGYANADAVYTLYHAETSAGTNTNGAFQDNSAGNYMVLQLFPAGFSLPANTLSFRLHGEVRLVNGDRLLFDTQVSVKDGASGRMTLAGIAEPGEEGDYVPLGFGIKRLGIADYRRVEQTTCCYVPGEVSHIENVMAREYKEKSTRRLRRSEDTTTVEKQTEKEELTDTTSASRFEMNQQVAEVINKDISGSISSSSNIKIPMLGDTSLTTNFAYNTSTQNSNSQAVTLAKDVTERAMERVVQKVREERILKIVEEFEEQHKHGFDNRKGDRHVSGVYRWIDKVYKNQVYNYGKRLMYEFMIPQPAVFHNEAMKNIVNGTTAQVLEKPVDPRTAGLTDYRNITEATAAKWAAIYGAEIEAPLDEYITVSKAFEMNSSDAPARNYTGAKSFKMELPDGYESTGAKVAASFMYYLDVHEYSHANIRVNDALVYAWDYSNRDVAVSFSSPVKKELAVSAEVRDLGGLTINVIANCRRTSEELRRWQISCFNEIIKAFEKKLADYNDAVAAIQVDAGSKGTNPGFYRLIENTVLRKNCITYLVSTNNLGKKFYNGNTVDTLSPDITEAMDRYAARAKFMEQAFEWELMSYSFYPFYWGDKAAWQNMYQAEVNDPLFRSFLQAGMARAIVTVRPGFEEAVMHYMATGQIWNGGQVPVIGDELYLSIVEELKNPEYYVEETWETRVPTTLTVIQAGSIGLNTQGLPCDCGDTEPEILQLDEVMVGEMNGNDHGNIPVYPPVDTPVFPGGIETGVAG